MRRTGVVTEGGAPATLLGTPIRVGDAAPDFMLDRFELPQGLVRVSLADTPPRPRLFSVVPSLDTPVCSQQTVRFARELARFGETVAAYTISVDTPYAMNRFTDCEGTAVLTPLSDYRPERSFGRAYGVLIEEHGELARALFVLSADGLVVHSEVTPDTWDHPDYDAALGALERAASVSAG